MAVNPYRCPAVAPPNTQTLRPADRTQPTDKGSRPSERLPSVQSEARSPLQCFSKTVERSQLRLVRCRELSWKEERLTTNSNTATETSELRPINRHADGLALVLKRQRVVAVPRRVPIPRQPTGSACPKVPKFGFRRFRIVAVTKSGSAFATDLHRTIIGMLD